MQKTILVFGLIAGAIASTTMAIMMLIHKQDPTTFESGELVGYASMLLWASLIPVAIKSYRDRYRAGSISFKEGFGIGLGIAVIASAMYVITWVVIYKAVYPNFIQDFTKCSIDKLVAEGKSPAEITKAKEQLQSMFSYYNTWWGLIGITFMEIFPFGLIVALLSALVLKRTKADLVTTL